ncbi:hypothetical protein WN944_010826 [Citrus x changshan-huyou]|uniref:Uncharacterized protein n=1 Tax=Citrus x changshan-huyou TaxID=2935761 RepID=A0AAP0MSE2_9ROSI
MKCLGATAVICETRALRISFLIFVFILKIIKKTNFKIRYPSPGFGSMGSPKPRTEPRCIQVSKITSRYRIYFNPIWVKLVPNYPGLSESRLSCHPYMILVAFFFLSFFSSLFISFVW